ncbi:hypothetical protein N9S00_09080, partial [Luminiphilus sp.]|nr:hypothetical protein [Luminiphilus sp.]
HKCFVEGYCTDRCAGSGVGPCVSQSADTLILCRSAATIKAALAEEAPLKVLCCVGNAHSKHCRALQWANPDL